MAVIAPPAITALPSPPDPNTRATFNALAYPWSVALTPWTTQVTALGANVALNATDAAASATAAAASVVTAAASVTDATTQANLAAASAATAGAVLWVSGNTYNAGAVVYSPLTFTNFRRITTGAGTTDPSLASTVWASLGGLSLAQVQAAALCF